MVHERAEGSCTSRTLLQFRIRAVPEITSDPLQCRNTAHAGGVPPDLFFSPSPWNRCAPWRGDDDDVEAQKVRELESGT